MSLNRYLFLRINDRGQKKERGRQNEQHKGVEFKLSEMADGADAVTYIHRFTGNIDFGIFGIQPPALD